MTALMDLPASGGDYALVFQIGKDLQLNAGRLGSVAIPSGWALYFGSARGPGGLRARLARHARPPRQKRVHWHVDYLTAAVPLNELWWCVNLVRRECAWARTAASIGQGIPSFGSSDCRCDSHLLVLDARSLVELFWDQLSQTGEGRVNRIRLDQEST